MGSAVAVKTTDGMQVLIFSDHIASVEVRAADRCTIILANDHEYEVEHTLDELWKSFVELGFLKLF